MWRAGDDSPTDAVVPDPTFLLDLVGWTATVVAIIHGSQRRGDCAPWRCA